MSHVAIYVAGFTYEIMLIFSKSTTNSTSFWPICSRSVCVSEILIHGHSIYWKKPMNLFCLIRRLVVKLLIIGRLKLFGRNSILIAQILLIHSFIFLTFTPNRATSGRHCTTKETNGWFGWAVEPHDATGLGSCGCLELLAPQHAGFEDFVVFVGYAVMCAFRLRSIIGTDP